MKFRYEDLKVTGLVLDFIDVVYASAERFPSQEKFELAGQIRRAAQSVLLNIAEGSARNSKADFARFLQMSLGSLTEVHAALKIAARRDYLTDRDIQCISDKMEPIWFKLCALRDSQRVRSH